MQNGKNFAPTDVIALTSEGSLKQKVFFLQFLLNFLGKTKTKGHCFGLFLKFY